MAYLIPNHISYILEANSERLMRKKRIKKRSSYVEEIEWADFFLISNKNI